MSDMKKSSLKYAFTQTIPVLVGYVCLGIAFGILLSDKGYSVVWSLCTALFCYAGSMQFVLVSLLSANPPVTLVYCALMTLIVNSRHIFYGIPFIERFKKMKLRGLYMIFSLTDETFSVLCAQKNIPSCYDEQSVYFNIAWLNHLYWVTGCVTGSLIGTLIPFDFSGVEFAMTALFTVIFIDQWRSAPTHIPALVGLGAGVICLALIGSSDFMFFALAAAVAVLLIFRRSIENKKEDGTDADNSKCD